LASPAARSAVLSLILLLSCLFQSAKPSAIPEVNTAPIKIKFGSDFLGHFGFGLKI
jgi:hypothetical protein